MQSHSPPNPPQDDSQQPPQGAAPCPACQAATQAGAKFCPECGRHLVEPPPPPPAAPAPAPNPEEPAEPVHPPAQASPTAPGEAAPPPQPAEPQPPADQAPPPPPGTQVPPQQAAPQQPAGRTCTCGAALSPDARFCQSCGEDVPQASAATPTYALTCETRSGQRYTVPLTGTECLIGKLPECDLAVPEDSYLSRRHARLTWTDGQWALEDLGSANGTYVKVSEATPVNAGDEILVGTTLVRLEKAGQTSA